MADDVLVGNESGQANDYNVATDDDGTRQYQWVKLVWGGDGTFTKVAAGANALPVQGTVTATASGTFTTKEVRAATSSVTSVNDTAASTTILASNANRLGAIVHNDSTEVLFLKFGATATTSDYTYRLNPQGTADIPFGYTGILDGISGCERFGCGEGDGVDRVVPVTQPPIQATLSGNTSGALAGLSSGTVTLAGGNNITLSQAGNAVTISAGAGAAVTGISALYDGANSISSGTVRLTNANNITFTVNGQTLSGSVHAVQTGISGLSNSNTTYTSGTVGLSELGAITIRSTTGNQFQFSVNSQSVQPETQTFVGGIKNTETTYTSGTVELEGTNNITVFSTTGQRFRISGANTHAQQTGISALSNSNTTYTSGTVGLSELGAITIRSTTGNQFQFSVNSQTAQTGISALSNSNTTYTSGTVGLSELGAITIRSTTGNQFQFSVNSQTVQTQGVTVDELSVGVSTGGNTAGNTTVQTGQRLVFSGQANITLSQATAAGSTTIGISAPTAGGAQTGISGLANSETTYTSGTVNLSALGDLTVRSTTGQAFQISAPSQTVQTATTVSSVSSANAVGANNSRFALEAHIHEGVRRLGISTGGNTAGTTGIFPGSNILLAGTGNITLSQSTDAASNNSITFSVATQTVQTQSLIQAVYDGANSITTGTIRLTNANGVSFSVNGQTLSGSIAAISNLSVGVSTGGNTQGDTSVATGQRLVFVGTNNITLSQATGAGSTTISISGGAGAAGDGGNTLVAGTRTAGVSSSVVFSDSNGISFGLNANPGSVMTASYQPMSIGVSTGGDTAGDTTVNSGSRFVLAAVEGLSASQATAAGATSVSLGQEPRSFWMNYDRRNYAAGGIGPNNSTSYIGPMQLDYPMSFSYVRIPLSMVASTGGTLATTANTGMSASKMYTYNVHFYSRGSGASSLSLQQATSGSGGWTQQNSFTAHTNAASGSFWTLSVRYSYPMTGATSSHSTSFATTLTNINLSASSATYMSLVTGNRFFDIPLAGTLSAGPYWVMLGWSSSNATQGNSGIGLPFVPLDIPLVQQNQNTTIGRFGETTHASVGILHGAGQFSTVGGATTASLGFSNISTAASHLLPSIALINSSGN